MSYAKQFYEKFQEKFKNETDDAKVKYTESPSWTKNVITMIERILKELSCNPEVNREYYRIDVIGWKQHKEELSVGETGLKKHLWELLFAVEHENDSKDWLDEVCKLSYIRCPLRVVIGYNKDDADDKIKIAKDILTKTGAFTNDEEEFLILLGPSEEKYRKGDRYYLNEIIKRKDLR